MAAPQRRINIELLLGISATFLSLAALVVSIFQTRIAREQQQSSVWPYLQTASKHIEDDFAFIIGNNGVGPALIKKVDCSYKGIVYPQLKALFIAVEKNTQPDSTHQRGGRFYISLSPGDVLKSGDEVELYNLIHNEEKAQLFENVVSDSSFHMKVVFSDVYGNCWQLDQEKVTALGKCPE